MAGDRAEVVSPRAARASSPTTGSPRRRTSCEVQEGAALRLQRRRIRAVGRQAPQGRRRRRQIIVIVDDAGLDARPRHRAGTRHRRPARLARSRARPGAGRRHPRRPRRRAIPRTRPPTRTMPARFTRAARRARRRVRGRPSRLRAAGTSSSRTRPSPISPGATGSTQVPVMGLAPESEPSPAELAAIASLARRRKVTLHLLRDPRQLAARRDPGPRGRRQDARAESDRGAHRRRKRPRARTMSTLMEANLQSLRTGLGCR